MNIYICLRNRTARRDGGVCVCRLRFVELCLNSLRSRRNCVRARRKRRENFGSRDALKVMGFSMWRAICRRKFGGVKTASCDSLVCRNSEELYSVFQKLTFSLWFRRVRGYIKMKINKYYLVVDKFRFFEIISSRLLGHSVWHYACAVTIKLLLYNTLTSLWRAARGNLRNGKRNIRKYKNAPISCRTKPNKERAASVCTL